MAPERKADVTASAPTGAVRHPAVLRAVGGLAVLFALLGLLLGALSLIYFLRFDSSSLSQDDLKENLVRSMSDEDRRRFEAYDFSDVPRIMTSAPFRSFFYVMFSAGVGFNLGLLFLGARFLRARRQAVMPFLILMAGLGLTLTVLPRCIPLMGDLENHFAAAWGAGNMGVAFVYLTYFWVWGAVAALWARGRAEAFRAQL